MAHIAQGERFWDKQPGNEILTSEVGGQVTKIVENDRFQKKRHQTLLRQHMDLI